MAALINKMIEQTEDTWLYLSTSILGLLLALFLRRAVLPRSRNARERALPVPPAIPLLGHSLTLQSWGRGRGDRVLAALRRWSETHHGAFQLHSGWLGRLLLGGPRVVVVLSDPAIVHEMLALDEDAAVKSRRHYASLDLVLHPYSVLNSVTAASSQQWSRVRRSLLHAFSGAELREDFEVAKAKALSLARIVVGLGPGVVLDVDDAALRLSLDVAGVSKLGYDFEAVEAEGEVLMLRLLSEVAAEWDDRRRRPLRALAPWLSDGAAAGQTRCRILHEFIERELWADIEARGPPPPDDVTLAAQLARLRSPPSRGASAPPGLPLPRILSELAAQLLMAHEPTGHCIAWALGCLAANKAAQDKLVAELKREGVFDNPQRLTYDNLHQLSYLDCVVREVLRLYPTLPCPATVRIVKQDVVLCGLRVLAGSEVWVDVFSMQRSPRHWRDPDRFNPERWTQQTAAAGGDTAAAEARKPYDGLCTVEPDPATADDDGAAAGGDVPSGSDRPAASEAAASDGDTGSGDAGGGGGSEVPLCSPEAFMPFLSGPRCCLGQRLAVAEVKAALAMLLSFLVFQPSGQAADEPQMWLGLFLRPAGGLHLMVAPRKRG